MEQPSVYQHTEKGRTYLLTVQPENVVAFVRAKGAGSWIAMVNLSEEIHCDGQKVKPVEALQRWHKAGTKDSERALSTKISTKSI